MNPRFARGLALLVVLIALVGCSKREAPSGSSAAVPAPLGGPSPTTDTLAVPLPSADRALIVTVTTSVRVTNVDDATAKIRAEVESAGGYVASSNAQGGDDASATMDLRVPGSKTAALRKTLATVGEVTSETEKVDEVTEQRADLAARLHNARTQEARVLELMTQKTGTIAEVLDAERELARIRDTIERLEAEQRTMESQIAMSTIHVTLTMPGAASVAAWQTPGESVIGSWTAGVKTAKALVVYAAMAAAALAPTFLPLGALALLAVAILRRRKARLVGT